MMLNQYVVNEFDQYNISIKVKRMSRGNVFKLSGNMALGGGSDYGGTDIEQIKNSLKLLKAKKNQRQSGQQMPNNYGYGGNSAPATKNYGASRNDYNYEALVKNNLPGSQKDTGSGYGKKDYGNQYSDPKSYSNKQSSRQNDPYDYSNKPPSYPQQNNTRNSRNVRQQEQPQYEYPPPSYSSKNVGGGKSSTANTRASDHNPYPSKQQQQQQPQRQQKKYEQPQFYNDKEERSIKQVNRQNQVDIVEYDPSDLRPCRVCGRKFNPDSLNKHESNCKQVFQKKRKQFNAQQQRIIDNQQKKLMKKGQIIEQKIEAQQKNQIIPKWKADSLAFRAGLKQTRNEVLDPKEAAMLQQVKSSSQIKCPHCGRKFNENAGPRHIKFCQEQSRKNAMKKKK